MDVEGGADGGSVCNAAYLKGEEDCSDCSVSVNDFTQPIYNELGQITGYEQITFACCIGVDLRASACVDVNAEQGFQAGDYVTYDKGGFAASGAPGCIYDTYFIGAFTTQGYLEIGQYNTSGGNAAPNGIRWNATSTGRSNLKTALGGGGGPAVISADLVDPSSISGGTLSRHTAALALNIGLSGKVPANTVICTNKNTGYGMPAGFGSLKLCNLVANTTIGGWTTITATQASALNGKTVSQVLADANTALAGLGLPAYVGTLGNLNELVLTLNNTFPVGTPSDFAKAYLCK